MAEGKLKYVAEGLDRCGLRGTRPGLSTLTGRGVTDSVLNGKGHVQRLATSVAEFCSAPKIALRPVSPGFAPAPSWHCGR